MQGMLFSRKRNSIVVRYKDNYAQPAPTERASRKDRWSRRASSRISPVDDASKEINVLGETLLGDGYMSDP